MKAAKLVIAPLAIAGALVACKESPTVPPQNRPAVRVRTEAVELKPHVAYEDVVGTVSPRVRSAIEAKVSGRIDKLVVAPGKIVKAGELLAELDVREMQAKLDQANAVRERAESDLKRQTSLVSKGAGTQAELDAAQSKARVARGAVSEAETMLGYSKIVAPFDGVITRKLADVGDLAGPGKPVLEIEDPGSLRFEAWIPEGIVGNVRLGMKLLTRTGTHSVESTVSEIAPAADPGSRTSLVKTDLPALPGVRAGQFGRVSVPVTTSSVLRVPASAVILRGQMELVFVVADRSARLRIVKTGKRIGHEVEILSGLTAGETIVTGPPSDLVDGQPVEAGNG